MLDSELTDEYLVLDFYNKSTGMYHVCQLSFSFGTHIYMELTDDFVPIMKLGVTIIIVTLRGTSSVAIGIVLLGVRKLERTCRVKL